MKKEVLTFSDTEIEPRTFHCSKYPIDRNSVDIDKIMISNRISFGEKCFKLLNTKMMEKLSHRQSFQN